MRIALLLIFLLTSEWLYSQALQEINYYYQYEDKPQFDFDLTAYRRDSLWKLVYELKPTDTMSHGEYAIAWERRTDLKEKSGVFIRMDSVMNDQKFRGELVLESVINTTIVVAKVINTTSKRAWIYYKVLETDYPVNGLLTHEGVPYLRSYFNMQEEVTIEGLKKRPVISHYHVDFPPAVPPFSESMAAVSSTISIDSVFTGMERFVLKMPGLYLVQEDTSNIEGFAFSAYDDYPKYRKLENLVDPLTYITTKQELDRMKDAKGDKKSFDKVLLSITKNADRAKILMRNYFRRVDLANRYFHSYKEGWKTDRGMVYIVFGPPDEVYKFINREVWTYKGYDKLSFDFVRSPTLFDPFNYVLVRHKKYRDTWYQVIDLWRNARF